MVKQESHEIRQSPAISSSKQRGNILTAAALVLLHKILKPCQLRDTALWLISYSDQNDVIESHKRENEEVLKGDCAKFVKLSQTF